MEDRNLLYDHGVDLEDLPYVVSVVSLVDLPYVYGVDQNLLCDFVVELYLVLDRNLLCDFVVEELEDLLYVYDDKTFPLDQRKKNFLLSLNVVYEVLVVVFLVEVSYVYNNLMLVSDHF